MPPIEKATGSSRSGGDQQLVHRRVDVADLDSRARVRLREEGILDGPEVELGARSYAVGDQVVCRRNDRTLKIINGDRGTVAHVDADHARVRLAH